MKKLALVIALALSACAPTIRYGFNRCPTAYASAGDMFVTTVLLALSVLAYNNGDTPRTIALTTGGMGVAVAANLAECKQTVPSKRKRVAS